VSQQLVRVIALVLLVLAAVVVIAWVSTDWWAVLLTLALVLVAVLLGRRFLVQR
jgi:hypothetical protein